MTDQESSIRKRAYALWESEGKPDGRDQHHWLQAQKEIESKGPEAKPAGASRRVRPKKASPVAGDASVKADKPKKRRASK